MKLNNDTKMKNKYIYLLPILISGLFLFSGCEDDDTNFSPASEASQTELIAGESGKTWVPTRISFEGGPPPPSMSEGFSITFNPDGTYTSTNGNPAFFSQGTWRFAENDSGQKNLYALVKDDKAANPVTILPNLTGTTLSLVFLVPEDGGSFDRTMGLGGTYEIDLALQ